MNLTQDTLFEVTKHLDLYSIIHLCQTTNTLMTVCDDDTFWKNQYMRYFRFSGMLKYKTSWQQLVILCYRLGVLFAQLLLVDVYDYGSNQLISKYYNATELFVNRNTSFSSLPHDILLLQNLKHLDIGKLSLTMITPVEQLYGLNVLDSYHNHIKILPDNIGQLQQLTTLRLPFNQIETLPESFGQLKQLTVLDLSHNHIHHFPDILYTLTQLIHLDLSFNHLTKVSNKINVLTHLNYLNLSHNRIKNFPTIYLPVFNLYVHNQ